MSTFYLINPTTVGTTFIWPGSLIDTDQDDVAGIQAAGGLLLPSSNTTVATAAAHAQSIRARAGSVESAAAVMLAASATAGELAAQSVGTTELADLAVTTGKLAALAVTDAKIGALAVTEGKIGALAVTEGKIGALAVTEGKIGALAVTAGKIAADAVTTAKILDGAVTAAKWANGAGVGAMIAAGLGGSAAVNQAGAPVQALAPDAVKGRACLVVAVVTEALTTTAEFAVASVGGVTLLAVPALAALNAVYVGAGVVPAHAADSEVLVTPTAGATGAVAVTVIALPTT